MSDTIFKKLLVTLFAIASVYISSIVFKTCTQVVYSGVSQ